jgi:hypothetical protein
MICKVLHKKLQIDLYLENLSRSKPQAMLIFVWQHQYWMVFKGNNSALSTMHIGTEYINENVYLPYVVS